MKSFEGLKNVLEPTVDGISEGVDGLVREILAALVQAVDSDPRDTIRREARILPERMGDAARRVVSIAEQTAFNIQTELGLFIPNIHI